MTFIEGLLGILEEEKINFFTEEDLKSMLQTNGYIEKKQKNTRSNRTEVYFEKEIKEVSSEEIDFFSKDKLNRSLNGAGFRNDKDRKVWYRGKEGKEILTTTYMDKLEEIGFKRYCKDTEDEYIDEPREEITGICLPYELIEELEEIAADRGLSFSLSLELILLEYLTKNKQLKSRHLNNIIEGLKEESYSDEEIRYIEKKYKNTKESISTDEICESLCEFYLEFFENIGFSRKEVKWLKEKGNGDIEFLGACYYGATHYDKTDFESLKIFYENGFRETDTYYLERAKKEMKQMGLTDDQIIYLISQNSDTLIEQFSELVEEYKLKTFEDIEELYRNEFFITSNLFFKYLEAIEIKEKEIELLKSYVNSNIKIEKQENILDGVFRDIKKFKVREFVIIERWMKEVFEDKEFKTEEDKEFMEEIAKITDEKL